MKFPIKWHEECLKNSREHYERLVKEHEAQFQRLERERVRIAIYEYQITRAKAAGKDSFDSEKYGKPKGDSPRPQKEMP